MVYMQYDIALINVQSVGEMPLYHMQSHYCGPSVYLLYVGPLNPGLWG